MSSVSNGNGKRVANSSEDDSNRRRFVGRTVLQENLLLPRRPRNIVIPSLQNRGIANFKNLRDSAGAVEERKPGGKNVR